MAKLCDESGKEAVVGKSSGYWLSDEDFVSTDDLGPKELGRIGFPRDWPNVYTTSKPLKSLIGKKGKIPGKKVGVVGAPEPEEIAPVQNVTMYPLQTFSNAERVEKVTGMEVVHGWAIFENLDKDVSAAFVAERYWWNSLPDGKWVDFSPRPEDWPELLLSEAANDAPKSKTQLREVEAQIAAHLFKQRFSRQMESAKVENKEEISKKAPKPTKGTDTDVKIAKDTSSETKSPASASVKDLVERVKKGDGKAVRELEDKVKGSDTICTELAGVIGPLVKILGSKTHSEDTLHLLLILTDSAVSQKNVGVRSDVISSGTIPHLADFISNGNAKCKEAACAILGNICHESPPNQDKVAQAGAVKPLCKALTEDVVVAQEAAYAVWNLTVGHEANCKLFYENDAIPTLIELLKSPSDIAQENAAGALMHISMLEGACKEISRSDAIPRLCELLAPCYEKEVSCQAAGALLNLATGNAEFSKKMVTHGAISALVNQVTDGTELGREYAAGALMNLVRGDPAVAEKAAKEGAIPILAGLLSKPTGHAEALGALANLASGSPERQIAIYKAQITRKTVALLSDPNVDIRRSAAALIMNLAPHAKIKERVVEAGAMKPLASLLRESDAAVKERAAGALANLFNDHAGNVFAGFEQAPEIIENLVALLQVKDLGIDAKRQSAHAVAMLAAEDGPCEKVWAAGAAKPLVALLKEGVAESALAIMNLSWRWQEVKTELVKDDALEALLKMLTKSDGDAVSKEYACGALMNMTAGCTDNATKSASAIPELVSLLKCTGAQASQSSEWAAGTLANVVRASKQYQKQVKEAGGIKLIADLISKVSKTGRNLVVLALTALADGEAESVRDALDSKDKAKLKEFQEKGDEELSTYVKKLVETIGKGFSL